MNDTEFSYIRPFNTKKELLEAYKSYRDITKEDRAYIKAMSEKKFKECLEDATFGDCFDIGFFCYIIHH